MSLHPPLQNVEAQEFIWYINIVILILLSLYSYSYIWMYWFIVWLTAPRPSAKARKRDKHVIRKHTYVRTYIHTYVHTYIRTYVHTCIHTYIPTYIRTCNAMPCHAIKYNDVCIPTYLPACLPRLLNPTRSWYVICLERGHALTRLLLTPRSAHHHFMSLFSL